MFEKACINIKIKYAWTNLQDLNVISSINSNWNWLRIVSYFQNKLFEKYFFPFKSEHFYDVINDVWQPTINFNQSLPNSKLKKKIQIWRTFKLTETYRPKKRTSTTQCNMSDKRQRKHVQNRESSVQGI